MDTAPCARHTGAGQPTMYLPRPCSVICSSSCKNMNNNSTYTPYKLFGANMREKIEWPTCTDICCWYCCHDFKSQPVCIPANHNQLERHFEVFGIFCSWNCAKAYIQQSYSSESSEQLMWMRIMAQQVFHTTLKQFHAAPPRIFLQMFGGHLTIEQFRHTSTVSSAILVTPPLVSYPIVQQEIQDAPQDSPPADTPAMPINPSMLAGKVVGLRRPNHVAAKGRIAKAGKAEGGMYSDFVQHKEGDGGNNGGGASKAAASKRSAGTLPGKGTLASFIRNRQST
jgi:hypothetical protein